MVDASEALWEGVEVVEEVLAAAAATVEGCSRAGPCWTQEKREWGTLERLEKILLRGYQLIRTG